MTATSEQLSNISFCVSQGSPEQQCRQDVCTCVYIYERDLFCKELSHVIMETDKSKICRVSWQAGDPGRS